MSQQKPPKNNNGLKNAAILSGIAFEMGGIIFLAAQGGKWLDDYFEMESKTFRYCAYFTGSGHCNLFGFAAIETYKVLMFKHKFLFTFYLSLVLLSLLVFCLHILILYVIRFSFIGPYDCFGLFAQCGAGLDNIFGLYWFREKWRDQIGFLFLGGSMLKFLFFFIVFYPFYNADGNMETLEFTIFFCSLFRLPSFGDILYCQNAK